MPDALLVLPSLVVFREGPDADDAAGLPVAEEPVSRFNVYSAEEMFLTGTAAELIPVVNVDARKIGDGKPGPMFKKLLEAFRERTKETDGAAIRGQA